ncbi:MAG TPA: hypothetical protein VJM46_04280 [Candidatus Saccharimonadales bacterium]|nr:hypothetical protein [Candidatus Saccharimonadales bacterium]
MRARYVAAAVLAATSTTLIIVNYFNELNMPNLLTVTLYVYGLGAFGLAGCIGLAYEASTGKRIDAKIFGGAYVAFTGAAGVAVYPESYFTGKAAAELGVLTPIELTMEVAASAAALLVGLWLIRSALRTQKEH